jgi:hypothetical protein
VSTKAVPRIGFTDHQIQQAVSGEPNPIYRFDFLATDTPELHGIMMNARNDPHAIALCFKSWMPKEPAHEHRRFFRRGIQPN